MKKSNSALGQGAEIVFTASRRNIVPIYINDTSVKKLTPRRKRSISSRTAALKKYVDFVISSLSAGQAINESQLMARFPERYAGKNSISALREVSRRYPTRTAMYLESGLWTIKSVMQP